MRPRQLLLLGALALGVVTGPTGSEVLGTPSAEAGPARTKPTRPAKPAKATRAKARKKTVARAGRTTRAAGVRDRDRATRGRRKKKLAKVKLCSTVTVGRGRRARQKKQCKFVREFAGHGVASSELRTAPLDRPSGDVWVYAENLNDEAKVNIYRPDGSYDEEALARLDVIFRCKRTQEVRAMDPRLYEQLSRLQDRFGKVRATVVSGFRFAERSSSRHFHASAIDIRLEGVNLRELYSFAQGLDGGGMGMGIYPHSNFIHVDYRAPGDPSYRWTDYSGSGSSGRARAHKRKAPGRRAPARRPTS